MRNFLTGILLCLIVFCLTAPVNAAEIKEEAVFDSESTEQKNQNDPSVQGEWIGDGEDWQYRLEDGTYLKKSWLYDKGKWYYFSAGGYMASGSRKIDGKQYYFYENGEMALGWVYDEEEEQWYFLQEDGSKKTGWYQAGTVWYWFNTKGELYHSGFRMIDGHKYYFFENGRLAENAYVGTFFYGKDGLREPEHDIVIQGKRKPTKEEKEQITKTMTWIPGETLRKLVDSGWELMYYTDKTYFSAPKTEQGIYYLYHKTDEKYKKVKFTKPEALLPGIGEYAAYLTGNNREEAAFMTDFHQYLSESDVLEPLPSYFDDKSGAWFGSLFACYCSEEGWYDLKKKSPDLFAYLEQILGVESRTYKPTEEELSEQEKEEPWIDGYGPADDESLKEQSGPASETHT